MPNKQVTVEWKIEWVDEDGRGHDFETDNADIADKMMKVLAMGDCCMMLDLYKREVTKWERV